LLAHELAHVIQQGSAPEAPVGGPSDGGGALEADADIAAVGAMSALWSQQLGVDPLPLTQQAGASSRQRLPRTRTGLRLQRCGGGNLFNTPLPGPKELADVESQHRASEAERRKHPGVFDPAYVPKVAVKLDSEGYFTDFVTSQLALPKQCKTASACTTMASKPIAYVDLGNTRGEKQSLGSISDIVTVTDLVVRALGVEITMFVPPDNPDAYPGAYNHELNQVLTAYQVLREFEIRAAGELRRRMIEARRKVAEQPKDWNSLIGLAAIQKMAQEVVEDLAPMMGAAFDERGGAISNADVHTQPVMPLELSSLPRYVKGQPRTPWPKAGAKPGAGK
jgi:hypothetical protein